MGGTRLTVSMLGVDSALSVNVSSQLAVFVYHLEGAMINDSFAIWVVGVFLEYTFPRDRRSLPFTPRLPHNILMPIVQP